MSDAAEEEEKKEVRKSKHWLPLESDPSLMNDYIHKLGVGDDVCFHEVYGTDPDLLMMVPQPVLAVLLLFPITDASEQHREEEWEVIKKNGQQQDDKNVYWMRQIIGNACGTIGLVHTIANLADVLKLEEGKFFQNFVQNTGTMSPDERAMALEANEDIEVEHQAVASSGSSDVAHQVNDNLHFIAFVPKEGYLWELDGRKNGPVCHGKVTEVLSDTVEVVKQFMERAPGDIRFNMVALGYA